MLLGLQFDVLVLVPFFCLGSRPLRLRMGNIFVKQQKELMNRLSGRRLLFSSIN